MRFQGIASVALAALAGLGLSGCGEKKTELGQGGSEITGSAGPLGANNGSRELVRCDAPVATLALAENPDRKSTRLNSSHSQISYAVFCLKKKNKEPCTQEPHH